MNQNVGLLNLMLKLYQNKFVRLNPKLDFQCKLVMIK